MAATKSSSLRGGEPEVQSPHLRRSPRRCEEGSLRCNLPSSEEATENARPGAYLPPPKCFGLMTEKSPSQPTSVRMWCARKHTTIPNCATPQSTTCRNIPNCAINSARHDTQKHPELCNPAETTRNRSRHTTHTFAASEPARAPCGTRITHSTTSSKIEPHSTMIFRLLQNRGHSRWRLDRSKTQ